jgi:integrase/recombinase XerC
LSVVIEKRDGIAVVVDDAGVAINDCARFLERLRVRGLAPLSIEAYAYDLAIILRWLETNGFELARLDIDDLHRFIAWERGRDSSPKSINRRLHTLRQFYRFVIGNDIPGGTEPARGSRWRMRDWELGLQRLRPRATRQLRVRESRTIVEPLTIAQVRELLRSLHRYRDLAIAHLMLLCGLRSNEALLLRVASIDFEDRRIRVQGNGNKERVMPIPTLVIELVRRYLALERPSTCTSDRLFVVLKGRGRGQPMTRASLRRVFRSRREESPALAKANPHRLRHTFGADMARSGVRLPILQRMMGHANPETTLQYVCLSAADIAAEFDRAVSEIEARYGDNGEKP